MGIFNRLFGRCNKPTIGQEFQRRIQFPAINIIGSTSDNILVWEFYGEMMRSTNSFQIKSQINPDFYLTSMYAEDDGRKLQRKLQRHFCNTYMDIKWPSTQYIIWPDGRRALTRIENEYNWDGFVCWLRDECMNLKDNE